MSTLLKDLQARFATQMHDYETLAVKADLTADDHARLDTSLAEIKATKAGIERARDLFALAEWGQQSSGALPLAGSSAKAGSISLEGFSPAGFSDDEEGEGLWTSPQIKASRTPEYARAYREYVRSAGLAGMKSASIKTLQEGADTAGGFLVPADILSKVVAKEPAPTSLMGRVTQLNTGRDIMVMPKVNYASASDDNSGNIFTTGVRVTWTGEVPSSATAHRVTDPVFGQVRIPIHTAMFSMPEQTLWALAA